MFEGVKKIGRAAQGVVGDARDVMFGKTYANLHNQLTSVIGRSGLTANAVLDEDALDKATKALTEAIRSGDEEQKKTAQATVDAIKKLTELSKSNGEELARKVIDRKKLDEEEAHELLNYLKELTDATEKAGGYAKVQIGSLTKQFAQIVGDKGYTGKFRRDIMSELADYLHESKLFEGSDQLNDLKTFLNENETVNRANAPTAQKILEAINKKMEDSEDLHELLVEFRNNKKEMTNDQKRASVDEIMVSLEKSGLFKEELEVFREATRGTKNTAKIMTAVNKTLKKLEERTVETKTLYTLQQLDKHFDKAVLTNTKLESALTKNSLSEKLTQHPGLVSKGKNIAGSATAILLNKLGLGTLDDALGISDWVGGNASDAFMDWRERRAARRAGMGAGEGGGRAAGRPGMFRRLAGRMRGTRVGRMAGAAAGAGNFIRGGGRSILNGAARIGQGAMNTLGNFVPAMGRGGAAAATLPMPGMGGFGQGMAGAAARGTAAIGRAASSVASGAANVGRGMMKFAGPAAGLLSLGMGVYDYANAENSEQRKSAVGSTLGTVVGGALGSFIPIPGVGTALGAMAGGWVGGKIASWLSDPQDQIPDEVKKMGPVQEAAYIDSMIQNGGYSNDDTNKLKEYQANLLKDKDSVSNAILEMLGGAGAAASMTNEQKLSTVQQTLSSSGAAQMHPEIAKAVTSQAQTMFSTAAGVATAAFAPDGISKVVTKDDTPISKSVATITPSGDSVAKSEISKASTPSNVKVTVTTEPGKNAVSKSDMKDLSKAVDGAADSVDSSSVMSVGLMQRFGNMFTQGLANLIPGGQIVAGAVNSAGGIGGILDAAKGMWDKFKNGGQTALIDANLNVGGAKGQARSYRNNNFGNIEFAGQAGATLEDTPKDGSRRRFAKFATPEEGMRALANQLELYRSGKSKHGKKATVRQIINTYAPGIENNTPAYIKTIATRMGVDPDQDLTQQLTDPAFMTKMIREIAKVEGGGDIQVDDNFIRTAIGTLRNDGKWHGQFNQSTLDAVNAKRILKGLKPITADDQYSSEGVANATVDDAKVTANAATISGQAMPGNTAVGGINVNEAGVATPGAPDATADGTTQSAATQAYNAAVTNTGSMPVATQTYQVVDEPGNVISWYNSPVMGIKVDSVDLSMAQAPDQFEEEKGIPVISTNGTNTVVGYAQDDGRVLSVDGTTVIARVTQEGGYAVDKNGRNIGKLKHPLEKAQTGLNANARDANLSGVQDGAFTGATSMLSPDTMNGIVDGMLNNPSNADIFGDPSSVINNAASTLTSSASSIAVDKAKTAIQTSGDSSILGGSVYSHDGSSIHGRDTTNNSWFNSSSDSIPTVPASMVGKAYEVSQSPYSMSSGGVRLSSPPATFNNQASGLLQRQAQVQGDIAVGTTYALNNAANKISMPPINATGAFSKSLPNENPLDELGIMVTAVNKMLFQ